MRGETRSVGKRRKDTDKRRIVSKRSMSNSMACGIDIGDSTSLASVYSESGDLVDRFEFKPRQWDIVWGNSLAGPSHSS